MKFNNYKIKSSFDDKDIEVFTNTTRLTSNLVTVFIHGLYGLVDSDNKKDKMVILANNLVKNKISNVALFNSARKFYFNSNNPREIRQKAFKAKKFSQEVDDAKRVLKFIIKNSQKVFGIKPNQLLINIHGNSLGGTIAILMEDFFSVIKKYLYVVAVVVRDYLKSRYYQLCFQKILF